MAIFITGDTHGDFRRFKKEVFYEQAELTKRDYVICCGDLGGIWDGSAEEQGQLDWLEDRPFTTLFVSGNHENFDLLAKYPTEEWHGGTVQRIRPSVIHLMRGQVYDIQGCCWPSVRTIAKDLNLSRATVQRALRELQQDGWIAAEPRWRENGSCTSNSYRLL